MNPRGRGGRGVAGEGRRANEGGLSFPYISGETETPQTFMEVTRGKKNSVLVCETEN